jgi:hypothetical protein
VHVFRRHAFFDKSTELDEFIDYMARELGHINQLDEMVVEPGHPEQRPGPWPAISR